MTRSSICAVATLWLLAISASQAFAVNKRPGLEQDALTKVRSWSYQLQSIDPKKLERSANQLLVVDYSLDGGDENALTPEHLASLRRAADGSRRVVLSYLSIGEAEKYRSYWQDIWSIYPPAWLKHENKNWCQNFIVDFSHPQWHAIIYAGTEGQKSYVDKIVEAGFDGIYLDRVDVYSELGDAGQNYRQKMIEFVGAISRTAKVKAAELGPDPFFVVAQNAEELLTSRVYRSHIDGLGKEDLLYGASVHGKPNSEEDIRHSAQLIEKLLNENKPVFGVEYLDSAQEIDETKSRLTKLGLIPLIAPRALDKLDVLDDLPSARVKQTQRQESGACSSSTD